MEKLPREKGALVQPTWCQIFIKHLLTVRTAARIPHCSVSTQCDNRCCTFLGIYSTYDSENIKHDTHLCHQIASEVRSHFTVNNNIRVLQRRVSCSCSSLCIGAESERGRNADLTMKSHSFVNDLKIINTP